MSNAAGSWGTDRGACAGRRYFERGLPVTVLLGWRGPGPRNVLVERADGTRVVRPFRGLRRAADESSRRASSFVKTRSRQQE